MRLINGKPLKRTLLRKIDLRSPPRVFALGGFAAQKNSDLRCSADRFFFVDLAISQQTKPASIVKNLFSIKIIQDIHIFVRDTDNINDVFTNDVKNNM